MVQVFEFDQVEGRYYIAMELVRGRHLGKVAERARELGVRLGLPRAVHACAEVARGLAYAHRLTDRGRPLGLVHRDVSPHNALVSFEGEVKLADFGIARAMSQAGLTAPGTLKGKLAYMAPEQARGGVVDARADVFSLGVVLWELCAGRRLFAREVETATLAALLDPAPPSPPSAWNEEVPPELDAVILGALEKDPARRTASAQALASALASVLLHIARTPDDWDLRAFMHRLWPEDAAPAPGPGPEATRVRPASLVAPPEAEAARSAPALAGAGVEDAGRAAPPPAPAPAETTGATRTAHAPAAAIGSARRRRPRALAALAAAALGLAAVAAARLTSRTAPAPGPAQPAARELMTGAATGETPAAPAPGAAGEAPVTPRAAPAAAPPADAPGDPQQVGAGFRAGAGRRVGPRARGTPGRPARHRQPVGARGDRRAQRRGDARHALVEARPPPDPRLAPALREPRGDRRDRRRAAHRLAREPGAVSGAGA